MKKGDNGKEVEKLQIMLAKVLNRPFIADGFFGESTTELVKNFQRINNLAVDGIVGPNTIKALEAASMAMAREKKWYELTYEDEFMVFVDAGHGGIDDKGNYTTEGKRAYHKSLQLHDGKGNFFEGHENRIVAEMFIRELNKLGIKTMRTYHAYEDTPLGVRSKLVKAYLNRGYYGYLHSIHSNAISSNDFNKLDNTRGFMVFTGIGNNYSDLIAEEEFKNAKESIGVGNWHFRSDKSDGDSDYEENFQILRETDLREFEFFGSILSEYGFHTSKTDCQFIIENRQNRVEGMVKTALFTRDLFHNLKNQAA